MFDKKTKIVATIGPASENPETIKHMAAHGLNVCRLNFSHGSHEEHEAWLSNIRQAEQESGSSITVLQDLSGPKLRLGDFETDTITLKKGEEFTLTVEVCAGNGNRTCVNYPKFAEEVKVNDPILIDDGKLRLKVKEIAGNDVICDVIVGGTIKPRRGVNLPNGGLSISSITEKDRKDLEFGAKQKVDFVALSFVRTATDVLELRELLNAAGSNAAIIAKIETRSAVDNIDEILKVADGCMVARGDLAVETSPEEVPMIQKSIIRKCNMAAKPVITATQMLESMTSSPVPTRAEVSDVANAILDGTDAIMLSQETAVGPYPVEAVETMSRVARRIENDFLHEQFLGGSDYMSHKSVSESITASAVRTAHRVEAKFIASVTESGFSARMIARFRPHQPLLVFTPNVLTCRRAALTFGAFPVRIERFKTINEVLKLVREFSLKNGLVEGERVVIACGLPFGERIETNMILVETL